MSPKKRSYHTIRDFLFVVFKHKTFIILFFIVIFFSAAISSLFITPVYEACSKLIVKNAPSVSMETSSSGDDSFLKKNTKNEAATYTAIEMLTGRYLAEKVISGMGVKTIFPEIHDKSFFGKLTLSQKAFLAFKNSLKVSGVNLIEVKFQHRDPSIAAQIVNRLIEDFLDYYLVTQKDNQRYGFFKEQVELMENKLKTSQEELGLFRYNNNISSITKQKSLLLLQISELEVEISKVRADISEQEGLTESIKKQSSEFMDIRKKLIALKSKEKKLNQLITQYKLELNRLDKTETRLRELERQVNLDEENYLLYAKKMEQERISTAMDERKIANYSVIEPAFPPITPVKPNKFIIIIVSVILGFGGGLLLAFIIEYFTHTFDDIQEMEETLGRKAIAYFPELSQKEIDLSRKYSIPDKLITECGRIKNNIIKTMPQKNRSILFSCSKEKEGTSTVLFNFAVALASQDERVLVVDANLRKPSVHKSFHVEASKKGLSDLIVERVKIDDVIIKTQVENLSVITCGTAYQANPLMLLQSEGFNSFMQEVKTKAEWVLFDSPPINTYNDSCIIASHTDSVVMVIKAGKTRWEVAISALNQIKQWNDQISGAVLNRKKMYIPDWMYKML